MSANLSLAELVGALRPELLIVNDNDTAMKLALFLGVADQLFDPGGSDPCGKYVTYEQHPTHWIVCYRA